MQPVEYSQFLKRWVEKFDPEQTWLGASGAMPPTASEIRGLTTTAGYSQPTRLRS